MAFSVNDIYLADCFTATNELDDNSIALVITSPPYADRRKKSYEGIAAHQYVKWFLPLSEVLLRKLKPDGSFILNIKENVIDGERSTYVFDLVSAMKKQGWKWTENYIWHKRNSTPGRWPNRFRDGWEYCFHFTKHKQFTMYQDAVKTPIGDWAGKRMRTLSENDLKRSSSGTGSGFGRNVSNWTNKDWVFPDNVIETDDRAGPILDILALGLSPRETADAILALNDDIPDDDSNVLHMAGVCNNRQHSAAFPQKLPEFFIKLFTVETDLVFDPFLGSGTTAKVAQDLHRHFLGFELKPEYFENARRRLGLHLADIFERSV